MRSAPEARAVARRCASRPLRLAALSAAAMLCLAACASGPAKGAQASKTSPSSANSPATGSVAAPAASQASAPAVPEAKPAAESETAASETAPSAALPEISLPYRRPIRLGFVIASLHEPLPPKPKAAEPVPAAAPTAASPAASAAKPQASAPAATAAAAPPKAVPKATAEAKPKAAPSATAKPASSAATKKEQKPETIEPKNAASTASLAVVADPASEKAQPARKVSAVEGTRFELPFEGTGWTFLGEQTNKDGIAYDSRRFEDTNLVFVLNPVKVGDYTLRFQRQDSLRGLSYEELVEVSVAPKSAAASADGTAVPGSPATVASAQAPSAKPAAPASSAAAASPAAASPSSAPLAASSASSSSRPAATATMPAAAIASPAALPAGALNGTAAGAATGSTGAATTTGSPGSKVSTIDPASLATPEAALAAARSELAADRPQGAIVALDRLSALAPEGSDEACILYARALEKNGPLKDIKRAYSYYRKLRDSYPESAFWDEAAARCSYIERRYFDIR